MVAEAIQSALKLCRIGFIGLHPKSGGETVPKCHDTGPIVQDRKRDRSRCDGPQKYYEEGQHEYVMKSFHGNVT
jgi:hypothetical protein